MRKLAAVLAAFSAGVFLAFYLLPRGALLIAGAAALAAGCLFALFLRGKLRLAALCAAALGAALLWTGIYQNTVTVPAEVLAGSQQTARFRAVGFSAPSGYRSAVTARLIGEKKLKTIVYLKDKNAEIAPGDIITMRAEFSLPMSGNNGDYYPGIGINLAATEQDDPVIEHSAFRLRYAHLYLARYMSRLIDRIYPENVRGVMQALLLGDRRQLNKDKPFKTALQRAGLSHVVAVSGMHVAFLASLLAMLLPKPLSYVVSVPVIALFAAVTGFSPGVVRAGVMYLFVAAGAVIGRNEDPLTSLFCALALLLAVNPLSAGSVSLQLSFASTLGLLLFSSRLREAMLRGGRIKRLRKDENILRKAVGRLGGFAVASLCATLGALAFSTPLSALYFRNISLAAPVSNLLTVWAVSLGFGLGVISLVLGAIWLPLGKLIGWAATVPILHFRGTAELFGTMGLASTGVNSGYSKIWMAGIYLFLLIWVIMRADIKKIYLPLCMGAGLMFLCLLLTWLEPVGVTFAALDVGQGSCTVITGAGGTIVVDCGGSGAENAGAIAADYIRGLGYDRIDMLIFTHTHSDHANGAEVLLSQLTVDRVVLPGYDDGEGIAVRALLDEDTELFEAKSRLDVTVGGLELAIYPPVSTGSNEDCLSVLCGYRGFEALITGDMGTKGERSLLENYRLPDIELLVAGHHGAEDSSCATLLQTVKPEMALISAGAGNRYGHPDQKTLDRLTQHGIDIYRTDLMGTVKVSTSGDALPE